MNSTDKILAMRYARAYMDLPGLPESEAKARIDCLEKLYGEMIPYCKIFRHPVISAAAKEEMLGKITQERGKAWNFMLLIMRKGHYSLVEEIILRCHELLDKAAGMVKAEVRTPYLLPEKLILRIKKLFSRDPEKAEVKQIIAPELIGGFELKCGDMLLDASIKGQLKRLEKELEA